MAEGLVDEDSEEQGWYDWYECYELCRYLDGIFDLVLETLMEIAKGKEQTTASLLITLCHTRRATSTSHLDGGGNMFMNLAP